MLQGFEDLVDGGGKKGTEPEENAGISGCEHPGLALHVVHRCADPPDHPLAFEVGGEIGFGDAQEPSSRLRL
jgi:hypothetical protein